MNEVAERSNSPDNDQLAPSQQVDAAEAWSQYLMFSVDQRQFGIEIIKVREIMGWSEPTILPNSPHDQLGVLNLRGIIVPIHDLGTRFGIDHVEPIALHVIIIVMLGGRQIGLLVEAVSDILTIRSGDILPIPVTSGADQRFLAGLVSHDDSMVALLKLEELFGFAGADPDFFDM